MELLLKADKIKVSYGVRDLFSFDRFELHDGERIGLVGENGAGKTTLLNVLFGAMEPDEGSVFRYAPVGYMRQPGIEEEVVEYIDPALKSELGVVESEKPSGGERTRAALAALLTNDAPVLLCDEPTTNLDIEGIELLQNKLLKRRGGLVIISHDREVLDALCTSVVEIESKTLRFFPGNYSEYRKQKQRERDFQQFEYEKYRSEQRRLREAATEVVTRAKSLKKTPKRMGNSEARLHKRSTTEIQAKLSATSKAIEARLSQLEEKERPVDLPKLNIKMGNASPITSRMAVEVHGLTVRFGKKTILDDVSMQLPVGKRTFLLGMNGSGKSTLVRAIQNELDIAADINISNGARIGYFDQNHDVLEPDKTVLDNARAISQKPQHEVRTILACLGIFGDDVFKKVSVLSGGERSKVLFARLLASENKILILDEPTNHIDIYTMEALETMLELWQGTMLVISHDRMFINKLSERLVFIENDGKLMTFEGSYSEYRESRKPKPVQAEFDETAIRMRMAALSARMASPRKGDNKDVLEGEWEKLVKELTAVKR